MQMRDIIARLDNAARRRTPLLETVPAAGDELLETIVGGSDIDLAQQVLCDRVALAARAARIHQRDGFVDLASHAARWGLWFDSVAVHLGKARKETACWDSHDRWIGPRTEGTP